jgi:hypothetical protein
MTDAYAVGPSVKNATHAFAIGLWTDHFRSRGQVVLRRLFDRSDRAARISQVGARFVGPMRSSVHGKGEGPVGRAAPSWMGIVPVAAALLACRGSGAREPFDAASAPTIGDAARLDAQSARARDELWLRASGGDAADLARLADREGAAGLLEGLEEGGPTGTVALEALPFADDADAAYQRLGEILRQVDPDHSAPFVQAVGAIARRPLRQREPVDPEGMRFCAEALLALSRRTSAPASLRAPAISALRLLAERHAVDPAAIPTDLDPK